MLIYAEDVWRSGGVASRIGSFTLEERALLHTRVKLICYFFYKAKERQWLEGIVEEYMKGKVVGEGC